MNSPPVTPGVSSSDDSGHRPVLLHPLIENLQPPPGGVAIDGTLGAGGVTRELLVRVGPTGTVLAIDRDASAIEAARMRFADAPGHLVLAHGPFSQMRAIAQAHGLPQAHAVALDLGLSSVQLDAPDRGFSFRFDGPLDMRMDRSTGRTAADIVHHASTDELTEILRTFGEERYAASIAKAIVAARAKASLNTTTDLRSVVEAAIPRGAWPKRIHPATRTFQALRIAVNDELRELQTGLQEAISILRPGGRLGVISFHSLEDTLAKTTLHVSAQTCLCPPQQPYCTCAHRASLVLISKKAIKPSPDEISANPRARSARLRIAEKLA